MYFMFDVFRVWYLLSLTHFAFGVFSFATQTTPRSHLYYNIAPETTTLAILFIFQYNWKTTFFLIMNENRELNSKLYVYNGLSLRTAESMVPNKFLEFDKMIQLYDIRLLYITFIPLKVALDISHVLLLYFIWLRNNCTHNR